MVPAATNSTSGCDSGCRYFSFVHALVVTALNFYILLATDTFDDSPSNKVRRAAGL